METKVKLSIVYESTLERAFKTPILCDVSKVNTGYGLMPKVTRCTGDQNWGQVGSNKKVYTAKSLTQGGGFTSVDKVLERIENKYWKIEVSDFQSWMLGFSKFTGEWQTAEIAKDKIQVDYTYTLHSDITLFYPLNWIFARTFWTMYMKRVLNNIGQMIKDKEPYLYP